MDEAVNRKSLPRRFLETAPGPVMLGLLLGSTLVLGYSQPGFYTVENFAGVLREFFVLAPLAAAFALTARAGGADFSLPGTAALAACLVAGSGFFPLGVGLALGAGVAAGLLCGLLVYCFKAPAFAASFVVGLLLFAAASLRAGGAVLSNPGLSGMPLAYFAFLFLVALAVAHCYHSFTALGLAFERRGPKTRRAPSFFFVYPVAGALAALGGVQAALAHTAFTPGFAPGAYIDLIFIGAALAATRLADNRNTPIFYAMPALLALCLFQNLLRLAGYGETAVLAAKGLLCLWMLVWAGLARWACR